MSLTDDQKAAAVNSVAAVLSAAAHLVGEPIAGDVAQQAAGLLVDGLTNGTLDKLLADAQSAAAAITTEASAELAARSRK